MNLSDLLVTYNQVKAPVDEISKEVDLPNPNASKFDRFINYLKTKKEEENKSSNDTPPQKKTSEQGFPGWYPSLNEEGTDEAIDVSLNTEQPLSTRFWGDGDFDFDTEYTKAKGKYQTLGTTMASLEGSENKNKFTENLIKFLNTEEGKKYNPDNTNDLFVKNSLQEDINTLYKIAALESSYDMNAESNKTKPKTQRAVGYFQLLGQVLMDQNYKYDDVKNNVDLQFKLAFERLNAAKSQLRNWRRNWDESGIFAKTTDFQRIYAHWWCPDIVSRFFKKDWTDKDKNVIGQTIGKINIVEILARAREQ